MAYRLLNCCDQPLRVDLRGGDTLLLEAGALSPVLREELLYDNVFVERWLAQGLLQRLAASLSQVDASFARRPVMGEAAAEEEQATDMPDATETDAASETSDAPAIKAARKTSPPKARTGEGGSP